MGLRIRPRALGRYLNDQPQVIFAAQDAAAQQPAESSPDGVITRQSGVSWVPYTDELPFHAQVMQPDASPIALADDDPVLPGSVVGIGVFCAKELHEQDRVTFDDSVRDG